MTLVLAFLNYIYIILPDLYTKQTWGRGWQCELQPGSRGGYFWGATLWMLGPSSEPVLHCAFEYCDGEAAGLAGACQQMSKPNHLSYCLCQMGNSLRAGRMFDYRGVSGAQACSFLGASRIRMSSSRGVECLGVASDVTQLGGSVGPVTSGSQPSRLSRL